MMAKESVRFHWALLSGHFASFANSVVFFLILEHTLSFVIWLFSFIAERSYYLLSTSSRFSRFPLKHMRKDIKHQLFLVLCNTIIISH